MKNLITKLFPKTMLSVFNEGVREGERNENTRQYIQRKDIRTYELQQYIGKKIIVISNEWENPYVGTGKRLEYFANDKEPFLVSSCALTGEENIHFGKVILFSPEILNALITLDPFERWKMLTGQTIERDPPTGVKLKGYEQLMTELENSGFVIVN